MHFYKLSESPSLDSVERNTVNCQSMWVSHWIMLATFTDLWIFLEFQSSVRICLFFNSKRLHTLYWFITLISYYPVFLIIHPTTQNKTKIQKKENNRYLTNNMGSYLKIHILKLRHQPSDFSAELASCHSLLTMRDSWTKWNLKAFTVFIAEQRWQANCHPKVWRGGCIQNDTNQRRSLYLEEELLEPYSGRRSQMVILMNCWGLSMHQCEKETWSGLTPSSVLTLLTYPREVRGKMNTQLSGSGLQGNRRIL